MATILCEYYHSYYVCTMYFEHDVHTFYVCVVHIVYPIEYLVNYNRYFPESDFKVF